MIFQNSVLSFPDRGPWGSSKWRGNTSGHIVKGFLERWHKDPKNVFCDPMQGGGTSRDVAAEMGIAYKGYDLHEGFNILRNSLLARLEKPAETIFLHPPYKDMIKYSDTEGDLSLFSKLDDFLEWSELALMNVYRALAPGGHYAILMGNMRKSGEFFPLSSHWEMMAPGEEVVQMVKIQHNTTSGRNSYFGNAASFVPTMHEMLYIFRKPDTLVFALDVAIKKAQLHVKQGEATWRNLVRLTLMTSEGTMTLQQLYERIEGSPKAKANPHWQAKVRQVVQGPGFERISRGQYQLAMSV